MARASTGSRTLPANRPVSALAAQHAPAAPLATPVTLNTLLMSAADICATLRISRSHWLQLVHDGAAPPPSIKLPRFSRWLTADVIGWVNAQQARGGDMRSSTVSGASAPVACTPLSHDARELCGSASALELGKRVEHASAAPASDVRGCK